VSSEAPIRTAVVVSQLGYGGAERQTVELLRELCDTPWAPTQVVCLSEELTPYAQVVRDLGYPLSVLPRQSGFDVRRYRQLRRILDDADVRIVHAVNWFASAYCILASPRSAQVVSSIRNSHMPAGRLRRFLLPQLLSHSRAVLVNSARGRDFVLQQCRLSPDQVFLVPNGVRTDRRRIIALRGAFRRELNIPTSAPVVAYVGRNARVKNIPRLLAVASRLVGAKTELHVIVAGEGLDRRILTSSELKGMQRLHCVGPRDDIPDLLGDADVLLLTSDSEAMPNVVLEALVAGVPVVAPAVGDLSSMVPPDCGMLVPADPEQLSAAVLHVLANRSLYRNALNVQALALKKKYSMRAMAMRTTEVWSTASASVVSSGSRLNRR
jgi:glycosyltransferase involved in cell wall biosynthesis